MSSLDKLHYERNLISRIEELERRLMALEHTELSGVAGPQGATGATGATGPAGPGTPASVTTGDIIYYVSTTPTALNIGAAEQVLRTNAGANAPEWATIDNDSIANRTRTFLVEAVECLNATDSTYNNCQWQGWPMTDNKEIRCFGFFSVPADFVSGMTVKPIFWPGATGNVQVQMDAAYGADGQVYNVHTNTQGPDTEAVANTILDDMTTALSISNAAIGDFIQLKFTRFGADALDTINAVLYFVGFLVSYTADM